MPLKKNLPHQKTGPGDRNNDGKDRCPKCGETLENHDLSAGEEDIFPDDEFICPACCCGIYIEVKDE